MCDCRDIYSNTIVEESLWHSGLHAGLHHSKREQTPVVLYSLWTKILRKGMNSLILSSYGLSSTTTVPLYLMTHKC